jgi:exosome complex exonuclease DIS3/RRP44
MSYHFVVVQLFLYHRYADIIVHRLLAVSIGADVTYPELLDKRKSQALSHNLNYRNRMAQYAGRASVALHTHVSLAAW